MKAWIVALLLLTTSALAQERGSDEQVRRVIQTALDQALHDQVTHLFSTWMKDDQGQPHRAATGIRKAVRAYRHAIQAIETEKLTWKENTHEGRNLIRSR